MTRKEEARELRRQGFKLREIAEKMGIKVNSVGTYLYSNLEASQRYRRKELGVKVRGIIRDELYGLELPLDWEDELVKMFAVYHYSYKPKGGKTRLDVRSLIQLLCRRYRVPTPRKLEVLTYQGGGSRRKKGGYMDVLKIVDGITSSKPVDYIKYFLRMEKLPEDKALKADELIDKIPKLSRQGKNPRVLAGAVLYEMYKPSSSHQLGRNFFTQRYIADRLKISEVSLRNTWVKFFKNE